MVWDWVDGGDLRTVESPGVLSRHRGATRRSIVRGEWLPGDDEAQDHRCRFRGLLDSLRTYQPDDRQAGPRSPGRGKVSIIRASGGKTPLSVSKPKPSRRQTCLSFAALCLSVLPTT